MSALVCVPPEQARATIKTWLEQRWSLFHGAVPLTDFALVENDAWVVGSTAWRAVAGQERRLGGDLDLVFETREQLNNVLRLIRNWGKGGDWAAWEDNADGYYRPENCVRVKAGPYFDYNGKPSPTLADLWVCPEGLTMEEHILSFSEEHRRVGYRCKTGRLFRGVKRGAAPGASK